MATYTYENIETSLGEFANYFPRLQKQLLEVVTLKMMEFDPAIRENIKITIVDGAGGDGHFTTDYDSFGLTKPSGGTLAGMSVSSLQGTEFFGKTFAFYDENSVIVHELSHYILEGLSYIFQEDDLLVDYSAPANRFGILNTELNQAVIGEAARLAVQGTVTTDSVILERIVSYLTTWTDEQKIAIAKSQFGSFENMFNYQRHFYSDVAGISNTSELQRVGYRTHQLGGEDVGKSEGEWYEFDEKESNKASIIGNYWNILSPNNTTKGIVVLGNQYDNNLHNPSNGLIGTNQSDYLDGGNGNDYLEGKGGNDTLIGGTGQDEIYGGDNNDTLYGGQKDRIDDGYADKLYGGKDFDTYYSGDGDTIDDSDGKGEVNFEGFKLTGGTLTESHELYDQYEGDGGTYYLLKTNNTLIYKKGEQFLTIENYHKDAKSLGITLSDELPELTIIGHMANENEGIVTGKVVITQTYGRDIIVHLSTLDNPDGALAGEDYIADNNITVTIHAGETEGNFSVNLIDNQIVEGRESFFAQIDSVTDTSNQPIQYTIKDITPLTIEDDDGLNVSVFAPTVSENAGIATGAVTINKAYDSDLTFTLYTQDDRAVSVGSNPDYIENNAITVTIAAGSTYAEFSVGIVNDDKPESTETFYALVQSVVDSSGTAIDYTLVEAQPFTIEDNDSENGGGDNPDDPTDPTDPKYVTISVSNAQAVESAGTISFVVSLSEVLSEDVSIDFITTDGTAITGSDYVQYGHYGVTIPAGQKSAVYQVVVLNDEVLEDTENFSLTPYSLSYSGSENVLLSNSATGTIYDDDDPQYITAHISDASAKEATEHMSFTVSLSHELERDITITTSLGAVTIKAGERSEKVYSTWKNDTDIEPDETFDVIMTGHDYQGGQYQVLLVNTGTGTIIDDDPEPEPHPFPYDPDEPQPHDPLVLDLNQDGKITTIALADSQVYFDITGDGVKERVGWVAPQDGFLVYDKNMNGKIEGIGEVFGKDGISGFAELRSVADTNYDNIIDRRDALFSQLKVWQDINGDGISQSNELKSLSSAGVKNIELNVIGTNINLEGNILSEAGRYGDTAGERELAADIQLLASQRATSSNTTNTYEIDPITETLPQMRGYGYIDNSFKAYNLDPKLKELALSFMEDKEIASANFGEFILRWSGFYDMAASKGIREEQFSPHLYEVPSIKLWILERFVGSTRDGWRSEVHIRENLNGGYHTQDFGNEAYIHENFNLLMERYEAMFAIQAFYGDLFSDAHYDIGIDEFVIDDSTTFATKLTAYLNNTAISQNDKLYLASMMNNLEGTFLHFDAASMIDSITDTTLKATVIDIMEEKVHFQFAKDSGYYSYANTHVYGDGSNESLVINSAGAVTMLAQEGDDLIRDNAGGNTIYIYRKGDGADTISDMGGADSLKFQDITLDEVTIEVKNTDLIITLKSDPNDQIRIIDWKKAANRVESILFAGDSQVDLNELLFPKTEGDDYIELTNNSDTLDSLGGNDTVYTYGGDDTIIAGSGNDTVYAGGGNDTLNGGEGVDKLYGETGDDTLNGGIGDDILEGGAGNDTYLYNLGDGKDVIADGSGTDTLRFGDGITQSDMIVKIVGSDMIIALHESGKTFEELSDVITIKNWTTSAANRIETITLSGGSSLAIESLQSVSDENDTLFYGNTSANLNLEGGDDTITTGSGTDTIRGGSGDDMINAGNGNDTLEGNDGDDTLIASEGNDTLSGGVGNDMIQGGLGDDLYIYSRGDGKDTIIDAYSFGYNGANQYNAGNDTLRFGEGITTADLIARISGDDLIIVLKEDGKTFEELGDVITIKNWVNTASRVETIRLNDGSIVDLASIQSASEGDDNLIFGDSAVNVDALGGNDTLTTGSANDTLQGGEGNDTLRSGDGSDTLVGDGGNDTLIAGSGNDTLEGSDGADILYGENGNDTLAGNRGSDTLVGGLGNDTYQFAIGDGKDTIIDEYGYGSAGVDTLRFGEGITVENLVARAVSGSNDLQIALRESGIGFDALSDVITLKNWFDANKRIENITLFDGTVVSLSEMQGGTDGDDYLVFGDADTVIDALGGDDTVISANGNDTLSGGTGNDILISNNGNDTLSGGEGNDTLKAGDGNDTLSGGTDTDTLEGGAGNDTYRFGIGDGKDRITDSSGLDTLIFGEGITADNLIARVVSESDDLQIAIREDGMTFDQLSDVITISGWRNAAYRVENLRLSDGTTVALTQIERSSEGDDYLVFGDEGVIVDALGGNDTLITGEGADTVSGGAGNDTLLSGKGNDTLSSGAGTDTLKGGTGNDIYLFNRGDGADNIFDELGNDTLKFGDGITKDDLIFKQQGNSLLIGIAEVNKTFDQLSDVVTLTDWFKSDTNIETITFADNTSMNQSDIAGLFVANNIHGALYSKPGAIMYGGSGDNTYVYNRGDFAVVIDDQYQQGQIDVNAGSDTLYLSGGINKNDVTFGVVGNDLILKITPKVETYEQLRDYVVIKNWANTNRGIEKVIFSNGENLVIDKSTIYPTTTFNYGWVSSQYLIYGDDINAISGSAIDETFETNGGNDTINTGGGNDRIDAGAGNDTIEGGAGNDVITMGTGDDDVTDSGGNDVYKFSKGDGKDTIYDLSGNDTLLFGEGISKNDLIVQQSGSNLIVGIADGEKSFEELSDKITIKNWFYNNNKIENFQLFDGEMVNPNELISVTPIDNVNFQSMQFDGNDTITLLSREEAMQITNSFSFGAWIKVSATHQIDPESSSGVEGVWNQHYAFEPSSGGNSTADGYLGAGLSVGTNGISVYEHCGWYLPATAVYSGNIGTEFNHIMVVYENKIPHIYLNGNLVYTGRESILSNVFSPYIAGGMNPYGYINGLMDDIQIYDRALSADEVMNIKNGSVLTDGLVVKYDFEGNDSLMDKSGNGHTAIVNGNPTIIDSIHPIHSETFENGATGWSNNTTESASELSRFLGRFGGTGGNEGVSKTYDFGVANANKQITIEFDMYEIDSWDGEEFRIFINNNIFTSNQLWVDGHAPYVANGDRDLGIKTSAEQFTGWGAEDIHHYNLTTQLDEFGKIKLGFGSTLDESLSNESFGIDNIKMFMESLTYSPPLILDLNANGKTSVSLTDSHAYFDYASDGLKEHTAWIEKGDGLLVRDINNDGIINDGSELFGDKTKLADGSLATDGYAALAQYDTNSDGVIDKNDTDFAQLKLWKDANLNGKTDAGELIDLSVAGVTSLSLNRTDGSVFTQTTENGNIVTNETNYTTLSDTGTMRDVWFKIDAADTITDNDTIYATSETETLSGDVGNDTYVIAFGGGSDVIDDNGNGADTIKFTSGITSDRLVVQWIRGTDDLRIGIRENAEDDTPITELPNTLTIKNWFNDTGAIEQFIFNDGTTLNRQGIYDLLLDVEGDLTMRVLDAGDTLSGNSGNDVLYGLEGSEMLYGKEGSDYLSGLSGDDYLSAGAGDDTLEGGSGDDTLEGGVGDDYYLFEKGDGKDLIIDAGGVDTLYFGDGIVSRDVIINEIGEDLVLTFAYDSETNIDNIDQITIKNWTTNDFKIESLSFADGHEYSVSALIAKNTNHAPEMFFEENDRNLGKERSAKGILLADDIDGDSLTYTVVSAPTKGTISINQYGIWTYTGTSRDAGTDTVTIAIQDGRGGEVMTTLSFIMEALNQAPDAPTEVSNTLQDIRILSGEVGATDIDGDTLTYSVSTSAVHGTLSINEAGEWSYSAAEGYMGSDSAIITIDDNNGGVIEQTLSFDVKVSAPTLSDTTSELLEDTATNGVFNVTNPIGGALTYEILNASTKGVFSVDESGNWNYNPNANLNGNDSVTIKVTNAYGLSTTATLNLAIEAVNDAPILTETPEPKTLLAGASTTGAIKATDVDGDVLSYSVTTAPAHGTLTLNDKGEYTYTAERYYAGNSSATVNVSDGHGGSVATTLNFTNLMTPDWQYTYTGDTMSINDNNGIDTLKMDNISMADLTFLQEGNNLRIDVKDKNDVILEGYFTSPTKGVESLQTTEGSINLSKEKIGSSRSIFGIKLGSAKADLISGSNSSDLIYGDKGNDTLLGNNGADSLFGDAGNDLLIGGEGNDTLSGGDNNDILYGDKGNDTLLGGEGNDTLHGGKGNNTLIGSTGNDTYLATKGANNTTINESILGFNLFGHYFGQNGGNDVVKFGEGITKDDISFLMKGNDLLLQYGESEFITIQNQKNEANRIEKLQLSDGSYLTNTDMDKIIQQLSAYSKDHGFHLKDNTQIQNNQALMNIVAAGWHTA